MPILSIVIPTHNRSHYAIPTIKSILTISKDIQVVVSDSSEIDLLTPTFKYLNENSRLKIIRHTGVVSVVDNFNAALNAADGDYVAFIGDDDFVSCDILTLTKWAKSNNIDSLKLNFPVFYYWPDYKHASRGQFYAGTLQISPFTGVIEQHKTLEPFFHALENFGGGVFDMPRAYAGIISSSLANKIVDKYGELFGGVSPDIYSSALIANESSNCVSVDFPVVIPGASGKSTAGQSAAGGHRGKLRDNPHIAAFQTLVWDIRIPEFYSVPTVWSFSLLRALEKLAKKNPKLVIKPNFSRLILKCLIYHPAEYKATLISLLFLLRNQGVFKTSLKFTKAVYSEFKWGLFRIRNRFISRHVKNNVKIIKDLDDTLAARKALQKYISACGVILKY